MANTLKERREAQGLSQIQVARAAGITEKAVRQIEKGQVSPRLSTARALATALGCSIDELVPEAAPA